MGDTTKVPSQAIPSVSQRRSTGRRIAGLLCCGLLFLLSAPVHVTLAEETAAAWPFFAFDNGVGRGEWSPDQQAEILAELGYEGIGYTGVENIPAMVKALQARGLKMFSTYVPVNLKDGQPPFDPGLPAAIQQLKGTGTALWIYVLGDEASSTRQDERAVEIIRQIADMAEAAELPVVLYPHLGFYVATTADAVRIAKKIDRKSVGVSLNLCHFLKQNDAAELRQRLQEAMPYLFLVSINGCDAGDTRQMGWDRLIQTLDRGTFDVGQFLQDLKDVGYQGPIGLQCYAIQGDMRENLARSMKAWKELNARVRQ